MPSRTRGSPGTARCASRRSRSPASSVPSSSDAHQHDSAARTVVLVLEREIRRTAWRQNPQWTQASMPAVFMRERTAGQRTLRRHDDWRAHARLSENAEIQQVLWIERSLDSRPTAGRPSAAERMPTTTRPAAARQCRSTSVDSTKCRRSASIDAALRGTMQRTTPRAGAA